MIYTSKKFLVTGIMSVLDANIIRLVLCPLKQDMMNDLYILLTIFDLLDSWIEATGCKRLFVGVNIGNDIFLGKYW